ncbi:hypothetical protein [Mucilaginibacter sp. L3T2-6]|uniref:hypothetical protein n=1 Tax=Mucilaginibacter sp. L3T2-6 TaxID=3062491 RepID=UPI0026752F3D|nr:hypothetical protein [Mucilaginibacter sp. L3T2-6]MDO3642387.1 hypothetical protein [Mucilaginibacter sp. L3T2-6]MDV6214882.1 hypothetical protein [Mucilaginibacter sp. L3T2-6]
MWRNNIFGVQDDGRTAGLCSYFFVLGWSVSYFGYHQTEKTSLSSFHLRQTLFLYLSYVALRFGLLSILDKTGALAGIFSLEYLIIATNALFIVFWTIGLAGANAGKEKHIPVIGRAAQFIFAGIL